MTQTTTDRWQQVLAFPFRDPQWKNKLLVGSAVLFAGFIVPVVPWIFLAGYLARILRQIIVDGGEWRLPEWDEWGAMFVDGLKLAGVGLVYMLPSMVLMMVGYGVMFLPSFVLPFMAPASESQTGAWVAGMFAAMALGMVLMGLAILVGLAAGLLTPPAIGHLAAKGRFAAAFHLREWWPVFKRNLAGFALAYVIILGLGYALALVIMVLYFTVIGCCLMPFVLAPLEVYMLMVGGAVFGDAYRTGAA
jgi:hypothetical protein